MSKEVGFEEDLKTKTPNIEYWVHFDGLPIPRLLGVLLIQQLVNSRGDVISLMDKEQKTGWKKASEYGFTITNIVQKETTNKKEITTKSTHNLLSTERSLEYIKDADPQEDQVSIVTIFGRKVNASIRVAMPHIRYKGALVVSGSLRKGALSVVVEDRTRRKEIARTTKDVTYNASNA